MMDFSRCIEAIVWQQGSCWCVKTSANNIWTFSTATDRNRPDAEAAATTMAVGCSVVASSAGGKAPVAGIRVDDTATNAGDLRNRKQRRCRPMSDGRPRSSRPAGSYARGRCRGHASNWRCWARIKFHCFSTVGATVCQPNVALERNS